MKKLLSLFTASALVLSLCLSAAWAAQIPSDLSDFCTQEEWEMLKLTNRERLAQGLTPCSTFPKLQYAADVREKELVVSYDHIRPNGTDCFTVLTESGLGYTAAGENIASGQISPADAVSSWMNSQAHRENILNSSFLHMGTGYIRDGMLGTSWVQLFMNKGCSVSEIALSVSSAVCPLGGSLDDLDVYVRAVCPFHGPCYLPLLTGMCTGFNSSAPGLQTVTVTYGGRTAQLQVRVTDAPLDTSGADGWAVNWLNQADTLGLLSEMNRSGFTDSVTRLQFADLAVRLAEALTGSPISPAPADTFTDTADEVVLKAKAAGIAGGYPNGTFQPGNPITRQEICVMLAHVANYVEAQLGPCERLDRSGVIAETFPDRADVENWAVAGVALMTCSDVMSGRGGWIKPLEATQLQEAATLAVKLHALLA